MPVLARHALRLLVGVDDEDLGVALEQRRRRRVDVQLAEEPAERLLLVRSEVLVAEEDHAVLDERGVDLLERPLVERLGEVDAVDLGADVRGELLDLDRRVGHVPASMAAGQAADRRCAAEGSHAADRCQGASADGEARRCGGEGNSLHYERAMTAHYWPTPRQHLWLEAALLAGDAGRDAWRRVAAASEPPPPRRRLAVAASARVPEPRPPRRTPTRARGAQGAIRPHLEREPALLPRRASAAAGLRAGRHRCRRPQGPGPDRALLPRSGSAAHGRRGRARAAVGCRARE